MLMQIATSYFNSAYFKIYYRLKLKFNRYLNQVSKHTLNERVECFTAAASKCVQAYSHSIHAKNVLRNKSCGVIRILHI